jgi:hypothetical protein
MDAQIMDRNWVLTALIFATSLLTGCSGASGSPSAGTGGVGAAGAGSGGPGTGGTGVGGSALVNDAGPNDVPTSSSSETGGGGTTGAGSGGLGAGGTGVGGSALVNDAGPNDVPTSSSSGGSLGETGGDSGSAGATGASCQLPPDKICGHGSTCEIGKCADGTKILCSCSNGVALCNQCPDADGGPPQDPGSSDGGDKPKMNTGSAFETDGFPACPATLSGLLTASMVDLSSLAGLIPLGNSNPPSHTVPVDHVYFTSPYSFDGSCTNGHVCRPTIPFYVPGDSSLVRVLEIATTYLDGSPSSFSYAIDLTLCRGMLLRLAGITGLEPALLTAVHQATPDCQSIAPKHPNEASTEFCYFTTKIPQKSGAKIGTTGGLEFPEVWAFNYNVAPDPAIDWKRYSYDDYAYAICLFDLYDGELKSSLFSKFGSVKAAADGGVTLTPRTVAPICGTAHQSILGTAQGDWFATAAGGWDNPSFGFGTADLSLIHDNYDPTIGKFSIGGQILLGIPGNMGVVTFTPAHSGTTNREFSEIVPGETIYCYQADSGAAWPQGGKILVSLKDSHHLRIENQQGTCGASEAFQSPFGYER